MKTRFEYGSAWLTILIVLAGGVGCSQQEAGPSAQTADVRTNEPNPTNKVELRFVLAKADKVDGTEDHVVSKCPGCALAMDGKEDHALEVEDYELHFCSDRCRDGFTENTAEAVMALKLPEAG